MYCSGSMCVGVTLWFGCGGVVSVCSTSACGLYCSGLMCVGVMLWFGWGGVVSVCRLKH